MAKRPSALTQIISRLFPEYKAIGADTKAQTLTYRGFIDAVHLPEINRHLNSNQITATQFSYQNGSTVIHYQFIKPSPPTYTLSHFKTSLKQVTDQKGFKKVAKLLPRLDPQNRVTAGRLLNQFKLTLAPKNPTSSVPKQNMSTWLDVTAPAKLPPYGHLHLITEAIHDIESIFKSLGFIRRRYPEIESDWYYAEGLNIPKNHPARDDQETFYFSPDVVLTAHTSNGQLHEMERVKTPPIKMINIGKTYRRQASNTHSPMFHQFEGLLIDAGVNITHLIGVSNFFVQHYFGPNREIRLRPHHFQFTEPSFEVDINCHLCQGRGVVNHQKCKVCKSGWLELGGAGMVHPVVLKNGGIDPNQYSGFAFGWGVERVIMMKHQVTDNLRQLYSDDLHFLQQS